MAEFEGGQFIEPDELGFDAYTGTNPPDRSTSASTNHPIPTPYYIDLGDAAYTGEGIHEETRDDILGTTPILCGSEQSGIALDWFERIIIVPDALDLGNVLAAQTFNAEIYSSYRTATQTVTSVIANAGVGITLSGLPALPTSLFANTGITFTIDVSTVGPPTISGTIDYDTSDGLVSVPVTGNRIVMFAYQPEVPLRERLEWATDIQLAGDGTEVRYAVRNSPRQSFEFRIRVLSESDEYRAMSNLLFEWLPRVFGLPIWPEARQSTAAVASGLTTIEVDTAYGDFRVGGLAMVLTDSFTFDALEVSAVTATSITFTSQLGNSYPTGTLVMPIRPAMLVGGSAKVKRWQKNLAEVSARFVSVDNDVDLSDTTTFPIFENGYLAEDGNIMSGPTIADDYAQKIINIDNVSGEYTQLSVELNAHFRSTKRWSVTSLQDLWKVRQLLYALKGSQKQFWLPTFYPDITVLNPINTDDTSITIKALGYDDYIKARAPNAAAAFVTKTGERYTSVITSVAPGATGEEILTLKTAIPVAIALEDLERVEYVRPVRIGRDTVTIDHQQYGNANITVPTKALL